MKLRGEQILWLEGQAGVYLSLYNEHGDLCDEWSLTDDRRRDCGPVATFADREAGVAALRLYVSAHP